MDTCGYDADDEMDVVHKACGIERRFVLKSKKRRCFSMKLSSMRARSSGVINIKLLRRGIGLLSVSLCSPRDGYQIRAPSHE